MNRTLIENLATDETPTGQREAFTVDMATMGSPDARVLAEHYAELCGSLTNAANLVMGLCTGRPIMMKTDKLRVTFTLPTTGLPRGDVARVIGLARIGLSALGIDRPTPAQLQSALLGALTGLDHLDRAPPVATANALEGRSHGDKEVRRRGS